MTSCLGVKKNMWNKYRAKKTICSNGHLHASGFEAKRCDELHLLQRQGIISNLQIQKKYIILESQKFKEMPSERPVAYNADFVYNENGITVIEDTKGKATKDYIIKRKFMKKLYCADGKTVFRELHENEKGRNYERRKKKN